jgi:hypothetical protein
MKSLPISGQLKVCERFGVAFTPSSPDMMVGVAGHVLTGTWPLNGLRHPQEGNTTGWYIWAGEAFSAAPDFFQPLHVGHLEQSCPSVLPYLGLPSGWRFLIAEGYEDVWFDPDLLEPGRE